MKIAILVLIVLLLVGCQPQTESTTTMKTTTTEGVVTTTAPVNIATTTTRATTTMVTTTTLAPSYETVLIQDLAVQPDMLEVAAGSEVAFKVEGARVHKLNIILGKSVVGQSERLLDGDVFTYVFEAPGTYEWRSIFSGSVAGTIVVS